MNTFSHKKYFFSNIVHRVRILLVVLTIIPSYGIFYAINNINIIRECLHHYSQCVYNRQELLSMILYTERNLIIILSLTLLFFVILFLWFPMRIIAPLYRLKRAIHALTQKNTQILDSDGSFEREIPLGKEFIELAQSVYKRETMLQQRILDNTKLFEAILNILETPIIVIDLFDKDYALINITMAKMLDIKTKSAIKVRLTNIMKQEDALDLLSMCILGHLPESGYITAHFLKDKSTEEFPLQMKIAKVTSDEQEITKVCLVAPIQSVSSQKENLV